MLSCKQASELLSQSLDRPLTRRERWALRLHLWICAACRRFGRQLMLIRLAVGKVVAETEQNENLRLSPEARLRMTRALESGQ
jgi:predicted anti-sigma-YlaC factor YlaD